MLQVYRARSLVILAALAGFVLFWLAGAMISFPSWRVPASGLLEQPTFLQIILSLIVTGVMVGIVLLIGFGIAGRIRRDAAVFTAAAGLAALSIRGAGVGALFQSGSSPAVFLLLILEVIVLFGLLGGAWFIQERLNNWADIPPDVARDGCEESEEPLGQKLSAGLATALAMLVVLGLLAQSQDKAQVILAVGIAALVGTVVAHTLFSVRPAIWYWVAPMVVAIVGYGVAFLWPVGWQIGLVNGQFAALARPLPLDYASAGSAGSLLGYWLSRQWQASRQAENGQESRQTA